MAIDWTDGGLSALQTALSAVHTAIGESDWDAAAVSIAQYSAVYAGIPQGQLQGNAYQFPSPAQLEAQVENARRALNRRRKPRTLAVRTNYRSEGP